MREDRAVEPGGHRLATARLAVRDVAREPARLARAEPGLAGRRDQALDPLAAGAADEVVVLLGQPPPRAEQRALDRWAAHAQALADLAVGQPLELAHHEDLVMRVGQPDERAAQVVELLLGGDRGVGRRVGADEPPVVGGGEALVGLERDLLGPPGAAELVDAGVLGDLVDPRLERDRPLGLAHAAQRGDEDLLRDVLGTAVVLDHAHDVGVDPPLVARVQGLERAVVPAPDRGDQPVVVAGLCNHPWRRLGDVARSPTHGGASLALPL